jgi:hypothetical protein
MKKRVVSFSLTAEEYQAFKIESGNRGQTVSQYCKMAAFSYASKYPSKGLKHLGSGDKPISGSKSTEDLQS